MKPPPFDWIAPDTLDEALSLLAQNGAGAKILAGGQSLIPVLNFRLARPALLIDLNRVSALDGIRGTDDGLRIGAMTRQRRTERDDLVAERAPLLAEALPHVAHPQIRSRGTIGGSLAHADPAAELPAVMLVLGASFRLRSARNERVVGAADFFRGLFSTALAEDEILVEIDVPRAAAGTGFAFEEVSRRHGDFALLGAAAAVTLDGDGRCTSARLAFVNGADGPRRALRSEEVLSGEVPRSTAASLPLQEGSASMPHVRADLIRAAADAAPASLDPASDVHATAAFRLHLARVLAERVLTRAFERAAGANEGHP